MTPEQIDAVLNAAVREHASRGWYEESRSPGQVTLAQRPERMNHLIHLVATVFTCGMWLFVWVIASLANGRQRRRVLWVDEHGVVQWKNVSGLRRR